MSTPPPKHNGTSPNVQSRPQEEWQRQGTSVKHPISVLSTTGANATLTLNDTLSDGQHVHNAGDPSRTSSERSGGFLLEPIRAGSVSQGVKVRSSRKVSGATPKSRSKNDKRYGSLPDRTFSRTRNEAGKDKSTLFQEADSALLPSSETAKESTRRGQTWASSRIATPLQQENEGNLPLSTGNDPADIVNLALSLNESRRKWFQAHGTNDASPTPRIRSASNFQGSSPLRGYGHSQSPHSSTKNGGYKGENTPSSRVLSGIGRERDAVPESTVPTDTDVLEETGASVPNLGLVTNSIIPSEATMQRVQRAKTAIELCYQYRRLLQYLPELSPTSVGKFPQNEKLRGDNALLLWSLGQRYNPLQYVRNRRTRFREGCPLQPEADGWQNPETVRAWVSNVVSSCNNALATGDRTYSLPEFPRLGTEAASSAHGGLATLSGQRIRLNQSKPARPRTDWETNPWSLLADAYWAFKEGNMQLLEDGHGKKLYCLQQTPTWSSRGPSLDIGTRVIPNVSRRSEKSLEIPSRQSLQIADIVADRGRAATRALETLPQAGDYSSSSDRRYKWTRKMIRSPSASSSDESSGVGSRKYGRHQRMDSRDMQERALLERQLRELQAREVTNSNLERQPEITNPTEPTLSSEKPERPPVSPLKESVRITSVDDLSTDLGQLVSKQDAGSIEDLNMEGFDTTAPNSPERSREVPNITINLTPPSNQPKKNLLRKRPFPQRSILAEVEKGLQDSRQSEKTVTGITSHDDTGQTSSPRGSFQYNRSLAPTPLAPKVARRGHARKPSSMDATVKGTEDTTVPESKFRGLFKGAKIAELVASPVTKVGDLIWPREKNESGYQSSSSYDSLLQTDSDGKPSEDAVQMSRSTTEGSGRSFGLGQEYHTANLPVFKSPFSGERPRTPVSVANENTSPDVRAIHVGAGTQLSPSSSNLKSLPSSPSALVAQERGSDSTHRRSTFERRFAFSDAIEDTTTQEKSAIGSDQPNSPSAGHRRWASLDTGNNFESLGIQNSGAKITLDRIARLKVVQLSCAIRSNELVRRTTSIHHPPNQEIRDLQKITAGPLANVPDIELSIHTGNLLIKAIDNQLVEAKIATQKFSEGTLSSLHERLHGLHTQIADDLTQMARTAERGADELSAQLATDCTLDVKRLNEAIELVMRRRRRRMRWLRRAAFGVLEWIVLAAMWWVWLIVVLVRLLRGMIRISFKTTKWLLWL